MREDRTRAERVPRSRENCWSADQNALRGSPAHHPSASDAKYGCGHGQIRLMTCRSAASGVPPC
jgi:hypothetical protein